MKNKIYFIGIAGKTMSSLAKAFKENDWIVSGSDQEKVYPPISTYLEENNIEYFKGYDEKNVPSDAKLIVVGRSALMIDGNNPEYLAAKNIGCPVLSYPEVLQKYLIKDNSIVIAGTYSKTTISSLVAWILINAQLNPSYMVGGIPLNMKDGVRITDSSYSVVEGDESPSLGKNDPPKFMFYKPKYLLITATEYDHPEIFKSHKDYLNSYIDLVKILPNDGILFYDSRAVDKTVIDACNCEKVSFNTLDTSLVQDVLFKESAVMAKILCAKLNIDEKIIDNAILSFKGIKGRNEFLGEFGGRYLYHDLSQQSSKIKGALSLLKNKYPKNNIIVIFDPSATSLKFKENLDQYFDSFIDADQVLITKVNFLKDIPKDGRVTGPDLIKFFGGEKKIIYMPLKEKIIEWININSKTKDIIVFMSSGGLEFTKLIEEIKGELKGEAKGDL